MYQLSFSISEQYASWFFGIEKELSAALEGDAVMVLRDLPKRLLVAVACENEHKKKVQGVLDDAIVRLFMLQAKRQFFTERLRLPTLKADKFRILLAALVEFDGESDKMLIKNSYRLDSGLNLDGVYNFAFKEIKERWMDVIKLTNENALYLSDDEIFYELIKYLFSAISPKTETVAIRFDMGKYRLTAGQDCITADGREELFCALISLAPIKIELCNDIPEADVIRNLGTIFSINNLKNAYLGK